MRYQSPRRSGINPIWVILAVNVIIFVAEIIAQPDFSRGLSASNIIFQRFAFVPENIVQNPWTIFTSMFVHANYGHIISNMLTLYFFGTFALALVGEGAFLVTYFVGGPMGGLFFYLFSMLFGNPLSSVVGASGAIYALGGLLLVMRPNAKVITFPIPIPMPLWVAILVGFLIVSFIPGIAWEAHLGGILFGAAMGFYARRREFRRY